MNAMVEGDVMNLAVEANDLDSAGFDNGEQVSENVCFNLGELRKEETYLRKIYERMSNQLHKLEVEELELKQRIRKKDMQETDALLPPPPVIPEPAAPAPIHSTKRTKRQKRKRSKISLSASETSASEFDESCLSESSSNFATSPLIHSTTPTRRSSRLNPSHSKSSGTLNTVQPTSPSKPRASKALLLPDEVNQEPLNLEIDMSALNTLYLNMHGVDSEEELDD